MGFAQLPHKCPMPGCNQPTPAFKAHCDGHDCGWIICPGNSCRAVIDVNTRQYFGQDKQGQWVSEKL